MLKSTKSFKQFHQIRSQKSTSYHINLQSMLSDLEKIDVKLNNMALLKNYHNEQNTLVRIKRFYSQFLRDQKAQSIKQKLLIFCIGQALIINIDVIVKKIRYFLRLVKKQIHVFQTSEVSIVPIKRVLNFKNKGFKTNISEKLRENQNENKKIFTNSWNKKISQYFNQNAEILELSSNLDVKKSKFTQKNIEWQINRIDSFWRSKKKISRNTEQQTNCQKNCIKQRNYFQILIGLKCTIQCKFINQFSKFLLMSKERKNSASISTIQEQQALDSFPVDITRKKSGSGKDQKMRRILNTFYSIVIGIMSALVSKKYTKYNKFLGIIVFTITYIMNITLMKNENGHFGNQQNAN